MRESACMACETIPFTYIVNAADESAHTSSITYEYFIYFDLLYSAKLLSRASAALRFSDSTAKCKKKSSTLKIDISAISPYRAHAIILSNIN